MRCRSQLVLFFALSCALALTACSGASSDEGGGGGGSGAEGTSCSSDDECPMLSCRCVRFDTGGRHCDLMLDSPVCHTTCEQSCAEFGGVAEDGGGCVDPASVREEEPGDGLLGADCEPMSTASGCTSGICFPATPLDGFCTERCGSDADCGELTCLTYTIDGVTDGLCGDPTLVLCSE